MGSGKSTISDMFKKLNVPVVSSDEIVRSLQRPGNVIWQQIQKNWPGKFLNDKEEIDRKKMALKIREDKDFRNKVNQLIHPMVKSEIEKIFKVWAKEGEEVGGAEVPLLFEVGWQKMFDYIILIRAPREILLNRIVNSKGITKKEANKWLRIQLDQEKNKEVAHFVVDTEKNRKSVFKKVEEIIGKIDKES